MLSILLLVLSLVPAGQEKASTDSKQQGREIEVREISALTDAIRDEIYDYGYQKEFWGFETSGPSGPEAAFNIYISPNLTPANGDLQGSVIYKYPPFGEVIRPFVIAKDGWAYLIGTPANGFPWTQPNTKTMYLDDEELCRDKHEWKKVLFELDLTPKPATIGAASQRQRERIGYSNRDYNRSKQR
jgi:hypothetical protein